MEAGGKTYITYPSRADEIKIYCVADVHMLSRACAEERFRKDMQLIANDPFAFWVGGGDYAEFIGHDDGKRFDPDCVSESVTIADLGRLGRVSMERVRDAFLPIKDKCLGLLLGNHEKAFQKAHKQEDLHGWLCEEMGVRNLGYCALFDVVFLRRPKARLRILEDRPDSGNGESFRIFAHHGAGYASTPGGKLNRLIQFMHNFDADVYFIGHVHDQISKRIPQLTANAQCDKIVQRDKVGVITGSYLKTYAHGTITYGEQRGYAPVPIGMRGVIIKPDKREIRAEI